MGNRIVLLHVDGNLVPWMLMVSCQRRHVPNAKLRWSRRKNGDAITARDK